MAKNTAKRKGKTATTIKKLQKAFSLKLLFIYLHIGNVFLGDEKVAGLRVLSKPESMFEEELSD